MNSRALRRRRMKIEPGLMGEDAHSSDVLSRADSKRASLGVLQAHDVRVAGHFGLESKVLGDAIGEGLALPIFAVIEQHAGL